MGAGLLFFPKGRSRRVKTAMRGKAETEAGAEKESAQLYLTSSNGGEAFAVTLGSEEVHAFAWAGDSKAIYFATRQPWSKDRTDDIRRNGRIRFVIAEMSAET